MEQGLGNFVPLKIAAIKAALDRAAYTLGINTLILVLVKIKNFLVVNFLQNND